MYTEDHGRLAEWFKAAVLKTVDVTASGGSNPSSSAMGSIAQSILKFFTCLLEILQYRFMLILSFFIKWRNVRVA